jgi:tryptophan 2,3-dioxygenase
MRPKSETKTETEQATEHSQALTYESYLALDELLAAQRPRSDEHDELLFIVVHQVYELWFKELLHELAFLQRRLEEGDVPHALSTLKRVLTILKLVVQQIDVMETLTPTQFLTFRDRLESASGFQSAQFRELEAVFGRREPRVLRYYPPGSEPVRRIEAALQRPSLYDSFVRYLSVAGYDVARERLERDVTAPVEESEGVRRAILAAYRDDGEAAQICERMVDLDEGFQEWRYRHVKMVERTIGDKMGTGGSPGARYLRSTLSQPNFPDLWAVRSEL